VKLVLLVKRDLQGHKDQEENLDQEEYLVNPVLWENKDQGAQLVPLGNLVREDSGVNQDQSEKLDLLENVV
jgi:hypothetical protein